MATLKQCMAFLLCLLHLPVLTTAFLRRTPRRRTIDFSRFNPYTPINFHSELDQFTVVHRHESVVLECTASAAPTVTIHWLKNGERLLQGYTNAISDDTAGYEQYPQSSGLPTVTVTRTHSRLFLDCLTPGDEGMYTCVAETAYKKVFQNTTVKVIKRELDVLNQLNEVSAISCNTRRANRIIPARIFMWIESKLHYESLSTQLFCRFHGYPRPEVRWLDNHNQTISPDDDRYMILPNGDLVIKDPTFDNDMGAYKCIVDNGAGQDQIETFLYPMSQT